MEYTCYDDQIHGKSSEINQKELGLLLLNTTPWLYGNS